MNFGEIVDASIAQVVGVTQTDRLVNASPAFVKAMINKGYHIIERAALWKFSEAEAEITSAVDTRVCADTPADLSVPLALYSNRLKTELGYHDDRQKFAYEAASGLIMYYSMWAGQLKFYPLPTQVETFKLRYYKTWPDLVADGDLPIFPATFHDLLVDYGSYHLALRLPPTGDRFLPNSAAQPYIEAFQANLSDMLASDHVTKTFDTVPNYGFIDEVLGEQEW